MGIEIHQTITPVAAAWDALADEVGAAPFMRPDWFAIWSEAFGVTDVRFVGLTRGGRLAAVVPLVERHGAMRSATNVHSPMFDIVAADEAAAHDLAAGVFASRPRSVILTLVDPDARSTRAWLAGAVDAGYQTRAEPILNSPFIDTTRPWEEYESRLGTKVKSDLRRRRRRLDDQGHVTIEVHDGSVGLEALLHEGFRVEAAGWKGAAGTAIASSPTTRRFHGQIARWAAERGLLRLCFLRLDGVALAFDYDIEADGVYYAVKGGYDEEFRRFSPGKMLRMEAIEGAFARDIVRYEFLGANEPYKLEWADQLRTLVLAQAFRSSVPGRVERLAYSHGRPFAKRALVRVRRFRKLHSDRGPVSVSDGPSDGPR